MLGKILQLLEERGALTARELAVLLEIDRSALLPMLELLAAKGRIERVDPPCIGRCPGGCARSEEMVYYRLPAEPRS